MRFFDRFSRVTRTGASPARDQRLSGIDPADAAWIAGQTNRALRTAGDVARAREATAKARLPFPPEPLKTWDNYIALYHTLRTTECDSPVLDAGTGAARQSAYLPGLRTLGYTDLTGINIVWHDVEIVDGIVYRPGDVTRTEFPASQFGFVACLSVIEHGVDWRKFYQEMSRIIRPEGRLFVSMDYWQDPVDTKGREAFGVPVKIFEREEISQMVDHAASVGLAVEGEIGLECEELVVSWLGLSYTFLNLLFRRTGSGHVA
jgi:SAM-dependent methyltransferase